jgi:hypothetical protein
MKNNNSEKIFFFGEYFYYQLSSGFDAIYLMEKKCIPNDFNY